MRAFGVDVCASVLSLSHTHTQSTHTQSHPIVTYQSQRQGRSGSGQLPLTHTHTHTLDLTLDSLGEEWKWSAWDRIDIEGDLTLREFLKYMEVSRSGDDGRGMVDI